VEISEKLMNNIEKIDIVNGIFINEQYDKDKWN
jgi:hypothetical protein